MNISVLRDQNISVIEHAHLSEYTTFKLGGPCLALVECPTAQQMLFTVCALRAQNIPFLIMGFGSNILASDAPVDTVVLRFTGTVPVVTIHANTVTVDAGTQLDSLVECAINAGLDDMTMFSGIPGTVGGAIAGNAGAYGKQISDNLINLTVLKPNNSLEIIPRSAIRFDYRDSAFKHNNDIILHAEFHLPNGDAATMNQKRHEIISTRESKHGRWQDTPCAGSFFRNVEPTSKAGPRQSAGWFIEHAGAKELHIGGAHPYLKHANIITRDINACANDVYNLTNTIVDMVRSKFNIELVREVRFLGTFNGIGDPRGFW